MLSNINALSKVKQYFALFYYFLLVFFANSCGNKTPQSADNQLNIVCTTGMIADVVQNIGQEKVKVTALMGAGVDPHLYKATTKDLALLRAADIVFYNGLHLEGKMAEVLEKFSSQKSVWPVAEAINQTKLQKVGNNTYDPHIWFDVALWAETVNYITQKLKAKDPENAEFYAKNAEVYHNQLIQLDQKVKNEIASIPQNQRVLITAHDAFGYFGKAYQIEVKGLQGISTVAEFGLKDVTELVNFIVKRKIKAVFVETSIPPKNLEAVVEGCKQKGHSVNIGGTLFSDAMGAKGTPEGTYIGMVGKNADTIVKALK
jgi:manganese/zinc/iron transport system substrate-binding protein